MESLIKDAFIAIDDVWPHVDQGHYDLLSPQGEIILPQVWETVVEPGWTITMHMWPMNEEKEGNISTSSIKKPTPLVIEDTGDVASTSSANVEYPELGTFLVNAAHEGQLDAVKNILERRAYTNAIPLSRRNLDKPLLRATEEGHAEIVELLLKHGANPSASASGFGSALELAARNGHIKALELLLEHGADLNAGAGRNGSALNSARLGGHTHIVRMLEAASACINTHDETSNTKSRDPSGTQGQVPQKTSKSIRLETEETERSKGGRGASTTQQLLDEEILAVPPSVKQSSPPESPTTSSLEPGFTNDPNVQVSCNRCFKTGMHTHHHCRQCPDFDLCESCLPMGCTEGRDHTFQSIRRLPHELQKFSIEGLEIHLEVLQKEICRFLGPEAIVIDRHHYKALRPFTRVSIIPT